MEVPAYLTQDMIIMQWVHLLVCDGDACLFDSGHDHNAVSPIADLWWPCLLIWLRTWSMQWVHLLVCHGPACLFDSGHDHNAVSFMTSPSRKDLWLEMEQASDWTWLLDLGHDDNSLSPTVVYPGQYHTTVIHNISFCFDLELMTNVMRVTIASITF